MVMALWSILFLQTLGGAMESHLEKATVAGGCFWGMEKFLEEIEGVVSTRVGYTGGTLVNPSYKAVCTGRTGHAEAVEITFDPAQVSYGKILEIFFLYHDPTTLNRQGNDVGTQYRSAIFFHNAQQKKTILRAIELLNKSKIYDRPIVTEVEEAGEFYAAEDYHQKYLHKNPGGYCAHHPHSPKIREVLKPLTEVSG